MGKAGAVAVHFPDISEKNDALSVAGRRPVIVRAAAEGRVRLGFDVAHE